MFFFQIRNLWITNKEQLQLKENAMSATSLCNAQQLLPRRL